MLGMGDLHPIELLAFAGVRVGDGAFVAVVADEAAGERGPSVRCEGGAGEDVVGAAGDDGLEDNSFLRRLAGHGVDERG